MPTKGKAQRGRPNMDFHTLVVRIPREQHAALKELNERAGAPLAFHVRRALAEYIAKHDSVDALMPPVRVAKRHK